MDMCRENILLESPPKDEIYYLDGSFRDIYVLQTN
jgi:hypothetical protein